MPQVHQKLIGCEETVTSGGGTQRERFNWLTFFLALFELANSSLGILELIGQLEMGTFSGFLGLVGGLLGILLGGQILLHATQLVLEFRTLFLCSLAKNFLILF